MLSSNLQVISPDGFPIAFFQRFLDTLKDDVMALMRDFYISGQLSKGIGSYFIALIPKKTGADCIKEFRPISLIGSIYKILAKVVPGRLQKLMPTIISSSQGAFVQGRKNLDGIVIANACIHSRARDKVLGLICKWDLEKAFDKVNWSFLLYLKRSMSLALNGENGFKNVFLQQLFPI